MPGYGDVWKNDGPHNLNASQLTKRYLIYLLKTFNVEGRAKISAGKKDLIQQKRQSIDITQSLIEKLEIDLLLNEILWKKKYNTIIMVTTMVIDTEWVESLKGLSMKVPDTFIGS